MTLVVQTLLAVLDTFEHQEGIWKSTFPLSYRKARRALSENPISFAEWDSERGLYFLDFCPLGSEKMTIDITLLDFRGVHGTDHYRFEWAEDKTLVGVELQTHAPGPLPFVREIAEWIEPGRIDVSPALTPDAWQEYLNDLTAQTPVL